MARKQRLPDDPAGIDVQPNVSTDPMPDAAPGGNSGEFAVTQTFDRTSLPESPPPNPAVLKLDPMAELFGPGSTLRQIGDPDDEMPDEIRAVIEQNGLSKRDFQCILKEIPIGSMTESVDGSTNSVYIKAWKRAVPSPEYIAKEHGPGSYILVMSWRGRNEEGTPTARREVVPITISEKCAADYRAHQLNKKISEASATGTKVRDAMVEKTIEGQLISAITGNDGKDEKKQSPKEYIAELMDTVRALGLPVGMGAVPAPPKIEWDKILTVVVPAATAILGILQQSSQRRQEEQNKLFMLLLSQSQNAANQLTDMYKTMAMKPQTDNPLKELQQMVLSAMDIKEMMNPPKETVSDKIFRMVESLLPQIMAVAAAAQQTNQRPTGPVVEIAKKYVQSNPDFEKLKNDSAEMAKFVNRLDERMGWENADVVLGVVEWERPQECPRDPSKRLPPQEMAEDGVMEEGA